MRKEKQALVSGASFAGICTAYWMNQLGYEVTVVETAPGLKKGGTPVNILGPTIETVNRMGLLGSIVAQSLKMEKMEFKNAAGVTEKVEYRQQQSEASGEREYEIERDVLLGLLYETVRNEVTFIFSDSITALNETNDQVEVSFRKGGSRVFDLVFGCDGVHSAVRKFRFGPESQFLHSLQVLFSISIVKKRLIPENTTQLYSEPGKTIMLNAYNGKTDICFAFRSEKEISYDYKNEAAQREIIREYFTGCGWRAAELLDEVDVSDSFYFDKLCQTRMPAWTKGRVALVGDAAYCPSPAAGRGGSIAIDGAAALADAFLRCGGNIETAFAEYEKTFRPFIEEIQDGVLHYGVDALVPRTEEEIRKRYREGFGF